MYSIPIVTIHCTYIYIHVYIVYVHTYVHSILCMHSILHSVCIHTLYTYEIDASIFQLFATYLYDVTFNKSYFFI